MSAIPLRFVSACSILLSLIWFIASARAQPVRLLRIVQPASAEASQEEEEPELPTDVVLPPGVVIPKPLRTPGGGTNAAAAKTPEEKRLQELLKLKFTRTASAILDGLANQLEKKPNTNEVQQFRQSAVVSDWAAAGKFLRSLPGDHGKQVYRYLLRELPNASKASGQEGAPGQPPIPQPQPQGQGPASTGGPTLVMDDLLALAEAAPHELEDEDARLLGQLLSKLLSRGDALEPLLQKLERGVKRLGGDGVEDRRRAAELLVAANRIIEAGVFLLPLPAAREKQDWAALDLHARQLVALGKKEKDSEMLTRAWEVNQFILSSTNAAASNRAPALRRSFELMPLISNEPGTNWLRKNFTDEPGQGLAILSAVSQTFQQGLSERGVEQRQKNLELQEQVVDTFLTIADPKQSHWRQALNLLAQNWMQEAAWSKQRHQPARNFGQQYDQFGNMVYFGPQQPNFYDGNQTQPIPPDQVLASAPGTNWIQQLDESFAIAVQSLVVDLHLKADETDKALSAIEALARRQPRASADHANELLRVWARTRNPVQQPRNQSYGPYGAVYYGPGSPYGMRGPGISLTRAMQARNIGELSGVLRKFESLRLPLNDTAVVGAFSAAHSPAEVFRVEDIEAVFGPLDKVKLPTLANLAQTMRERLASQWRQPRVQQELKTQRTDKQIEAEALRGYELVLKLVDDGLKRNREDWELNLARAAAYFDLAEFQYGKKVDLAIYVQKREEAFKGFARAAELYATGLRDIEEKEQSPRVYQQWFNANLGASDLAYVTRQQEPATNQLQQIRDAILALPGAASERHLSAFAKSLGQSAGNLRPELKPRYLRAGLRVVGNHPDAEDARKLVTYYDDLLKEIELIVRLDGDATVGHSRPFGVLVSLRHTADIEREAGGFARYLRNTKKSSYAYYNPMQQQQQRNFLEDFEKQAREKLVEHFDIKTITFLDEKVQSRGQGQAGWRETPLAFLLLQAKDGAVDQIPAMHMDLDFMDSRGAVVLPVESQITLIDARPAAVPARAVTNVEVVQVLDDREAAQGRLTLEIKATGKGLLPELAGLLRTNFAGLQIEELTDPGLGIARIDTEGDDVLPVSERNWLIKLRVPDKAPASLAFHFPEAALNVEKMVYKRYADADLVEVKPEIALTGLALRPRPIWPWCAGGLTLAAVAVAGVWMLRRRQPAIETTSARYYLPERITPFAVISLLRQMQGDSSLKWAETNRAELLQTIQQLERYFFARERNGDPEPDLSAIGRRWVELTGDGKQIGIQARGA